MPIMEVTGELRKRHAEHFEWKIPNFSTLDTRYPNSYKSLAFKFEHSYFHMLITLEYVYEKQFRVYLYLYGIENKKIGETYTLSIIEGIETNLLYNISAMQKLIIDRNGYILTTKVWMVKCIDLQNDTLTVVCNFFYPLPLEESSSMELIGKSKFLSYFYVMYVLFLCKTREKNLV